MLTTLTHPQALEMKETALALERLSGCCRTKDDVHHLSVYLHERLHEDTPNTTGVIAVMAAIIQANVFLMLRDRDMWTAQLVTWLANEQVASESWQVLALITKTLRKEELDG